MLLGLLSDTHDNTSALESALEAFRVRGVTHVLHAGDITSPFTLHRLRGWRACAVFGNNDRDRPALLASARANGIELGDGWEGALDGIRIAIVHGDNRVLLKQAVAGHRFDLVVTGHSHRLRDELVGETRVVNPGALYRAARYTCAVYETSSEPLEVIVVGRGAGPHPHLPPRTREGIGS